MTEPAVALAPRVSVVVACFNLGEFVEEAIDSVLAQTFQDFEILVIDDGSTDPATQQVLGRLSKPRTRVIRMEHGGLARARNLGIVNARGEYLCALDADDTLRPAFLEKTVGALDAQPEATFASTWLRTFGDDTWEWAPERCDLPTLLSENTVLTAALTRLKAVRDVGGYDEHMPVQGDEDWDLWLSLVERGHRGIILPEVLFDYRRRSGSMSSVCWHGPGHVPLAHYRFTKHESSYRQHLTDVLLNQDDETAAVLRDNDALERRIGSDLEPLLELKQRELATLKARLAAHGGVEASDGPAEALATRVHEAERVAREALEEVAALRSSRSWRVTKPLRSAYDVWLRLRGDSGPAAS
ncbi:MAG TPA: glycosyltransferase family A protein [Vicinamibacterales bacterium]|nr:glycosyltransferase family A protein [Vicinamibacterales bacterium]